MSDDKLLAERKRVKDELRTCNTAFERLVGALQASNLPSEDADLISALAKGYSEIRTLLDRLESINQSLSAFKAPDSD